MRRRTITDGWLVGWLLWMAIIESDYSEMDLQTYEKISLRYMYVTEITGNIFEIIAACFFFVFFFLSSARLLFVFVFKNEFQSSAIIMR